MADEKKELEEAKGLLNSVMTFLSGDKPAEPKKEVKMESELAEGEYELKDGTTFRIDAEGFPVDVKAPTEEEAEEEEAAKREQDTMMAEHKQFKEENETLKAELSAVNKTLEAKDAEIVELSKTTPISSAPSSGGKKQPIELTSNMSAEEKQYARRYNRKLNK